jgi:A/G-specific adenine glycosylase
LIDLKQPGEFNQALMEFGALYCKPQNPNCEDCLFRTECKAYQENQVNSIPIKTKRLSPRKRYFYYLFIIHQNKSVYLRKRAGQDIWKNLYDFPLIEKNHKISNEKMVEEISSDENFELKNNPQVTISKEYKHILTHQIISARFYTIQLNDSKHFHRINSLNGSIWDSVDLKNIHQYPVPRLIEKFLKNNQFL